MLKRLWFYVFLCLFGLLTACVPGARNAVDLSESRRVSVVGGESAYFHDTWRATAFDIDVGDIPDDAFENGRVGKEYPKLMTNRFSAHAVGIPESWNLRVANARGVRTITDVSEGGRYINVRWRETVELLFAVDVPQDVEAGTHRADVTVIADTGDVETFTVLFDASVTE